MKTKTKKSVKNNNTKLRYSKQQIILIILCVYSAILSLLVFVVCYFTFYLWNYTKDETVGIRSLIIEANDRLSVPANIDAKTGNIYFAQANLTLPFVKDDPYLSSNIQYSYETEFEGSPAQLRIVNTPGYRNAKLGLMRTTSLEEAFDESVTKLQACRRGYTVVLKTPLRERADELKFNKQLQDGRTVYVYHDSACMFNDEKFDNYLKQIDSY